MFIYIKSYIYTGWDGILVHILEYLETRKGELHFEVGIWRKFGYRIYLLLYLIIDTRDNIIVFGLLLSRIIGIVPPSYENKVTASPAIWK